MSTSDERAERVDVTQPVDEIDPDEAGGVAFPAAHTATGRAGGDAGPVDLDEDLDDDDLDEPDPLPIASRRRRLSAVTAVLALLAVGAAGFYGGVLVQKHQGSSSSSSTNSAIQALASRFGRAGAAGANGGGAAVGAGGGAVRGTVKLIDGANIYVTDAQGNTVKVSTSAGSQITKTVPGAVGDVKIGETVVVTGPQGSDGTYQAQRVTIGGAGGGFGGGRGFGGGGGGAGTGAAAGG